MKKTLLATGYFSWDAVERRSDRYGSIRLNDQNNNNVLLNPTHDDLEGNKGRLVAEVLIPVRSPHPGDIVRGIKTSTPELGEVVLLGEGTLFIEHRDDSVLHEKSIHEMNDDKMFEAIESMFGGKINFKVRKGKLQAFRSESDSPEHSDPPPEIYDLVGLRPEDGREKDWLDPHAFYRLHLSKINLFFEED